MPEVKVKTISITVPNGDPTDMITITRQQFREALSFCLASFYEAKPDCVSEESTDTLMQVCGIFVAGLECKLFDDDDEEESDESV
jgi:hypothetical protein